MTTDTPLSPEEMATRAAVQRRTMTARLAAGQTTGDPPQPAPGAVATWRNPTPPEPMPPAPEPPEPVIPPSPTPNHAPAIAVFLLSIAGIFAQQLLIQLGHLPPSTPLTIVLAVLAAVAATVPLVQQLLYQAHLQSVHYARVIDTLGRRR